MNNELGSTPSPPRPSSSTSAVKESVQKLAEQGGETIGVITDRATEVADQLKQQYTAMLSRSMDFVQARPLTSVAIALGLGLFSRAIVKLGVVVGAGALLMQVVRRQRIA